MEFQGLAAIALLPMLVYTVCTLGALAMPAVSSKTFKSGNSIALRLPKSLAIGPGEPMLIEKNGDTLTIRRLLDPAVEKARLTRLLADLEAIGAPADGVQGREPFDIPDRPGL